jgi:citrate lyase subunit beta / citryl-CoA lyase
MSALPPFRSYLYVPGSNPHMIEKALASEADALILDLEDAVTPHRKAEARAYVAQLLQSPQAKPLLVRINALNTELVLPDIAAVATPTLTALCLPKIETPRDVCVVAEQLERHACPAGIHCLLESALAIEHAFAIASAHPRVIGLGLGEVDLATNLAISDDDAFSYARSRVIVAARAAQLPSPVQSIYANIRDIDGLRTSTWRGKRTGFFGRTAIHPDQLPIINEIFTPTPDEVAHAQKLLETFAHAARQGKGALVLDDGSFIDQATIESAHRTLALHNQQRITSSRLRDSFFPHGESQATV